MTLVVPFDGSELAKAALVRAVQFSRVLDEDVLAVTVIPRGNAKFAREHGWIGRSEPFDGDAVLAHLREAVGELAPEATFHHIEVDRDARAGTIGTRLRRFAVEHDASIVFIGSENAGRFVSTFTVGQSLAADRAYDTMIVSRMRPSNIQRLEEARPTPEEAD